MIQRELPDFNVRAMTLKDLEAVKKIEDKSFNSPWSLEAFQHELRENFLATYLVFEYTLPEGTAEIIGYGGYWFIKGDAHITNIAVDPDYRGLGAGEIMTKTLIEHAKGKGATRVTLEVRKSNEVAKNLYYKIGFKSLGIRPNYYRDNQEDAVIMYKNLKS